VGAAPGDLLLRDVRPGGTAIADVAIRDGLIVSSGVPLDGWAGPVVEGGGRLLLPGLVDGHAHLDKTLWGLPWRRHTAGVGLAALIENERVGRRELPPVAERAAALLEAYVAAGTSHVRTHVDVDPGLKLASIEGKLEARERMEARIDVQIVAFPQSGLLVQPGTAGLLECAIEAGADLVGGLDPAGFDRDADGHLDAVFGISDRQGCGVDIHLHDGGELGRDTVRKIVERTRALGLAGRVTISHAFCLADAPEAEVEPLLEQLVEQRISLATVAPGSRPPLPLLRLRELGIDVCLGQDGIRDLWSPYGDADMLSRAERLAWRAGFRRDEDIEAALHTVTTAGARVLGVDGYGLDPGCAADLVLVEAETRAEAVVAHPPCRTVIKCGRVVSPD
jgi:cytosine deaminase